MQAAGAAGQQQQQHQGLKKKDKENNSPGKLVAQRLLKKATAETTTTRHYNNNMLQTTQQSAQQKSRKRTHDSPLNQQQLLHQQQAVKQQRGNAEGQKIERHQQLRLNLQPSHTPEEQRRREMYRDFFSTHTFYLDVQSQSRRRWLERAIRQLGGKLEDYFSTSVNVYVTCVKFDEASRTHADKPVQQSQSQQQQQLKSRDLNASIASQSTTTQTVNTMATSVTVDTLQFREQEALRIKLEGKCRVVHQQQITSALIKYCDAPKPQEDGFKLRANQLYDQHSNFREFRFPYLLVECQQDKYRPLHREYEPQDLMDLSSYQLPYMNLDSAPGQCPFYHEQPAVVAAKADDNKENAVTRKKSVTRVNKVISARQYHQWKPPAVVDALTPANRLAALQKQRDQCLAKFTQLTQQRDAGTLKPKIRQADTQKKSGYCECCACKYDDFSAHMKDERHLEYVNNAENFEDLDEQLEEVVRPEIEEWQVAMQQARESLTETQCAFVDAREASVDLEQAFINVVQDACE